MVDQFDNVLAFSFLPENLTLAKIATRVCGEKTMPNGNIKKWEAWKLDEDGSFVAGTYSEVVAPTAPEPMIPTDEELIVSAERWIERSKKPLEASELEVTARWSATDMEAMGFTPK